MKIKIKHTSNKIYHIVGKYDSRTLKKIIGSMHIYLFQKTTQGDTNVLWYASNETMYNF